MEKLTGIQTNELAKYDNRTLLLIVAIRQAKAKQEAGWLKITVVRAGAILAVLQVVQIALDIYNEIVK